MASRYSSILLLLVQVGKLKLFSSSLFGSHCAIHSQFSSFQLFSGRCKVPIVHEEKDQKEPLKTAITHQCGTNESIVPFHARRVLDILDLTLFAPRKAQGFHHSSPPDSAIFSASLHVFALFSISFITVRLHDCFGHTSRRIHKCLIFHKFIHNVTMDCHHPFWGRGCQQWSSKHLCSLRSLQLAPGQPESPDVFFQVSAPSVSGAGLDCHLLGGGNRV